MDLAGNEDILIIGAGPHGLCLVSKLLETVEEELEESPHNRRLFNVKRPKQTASCPSPGEGAPKTLARVVCRYPSDPPAKFAMTERRYRKTLRLSIAQESRHMEILSHLSVIDNSGTWLAQWDKQFEALGISHLRSAIDAHPDPIDRQSLRWYAESLHKRDKFVELKLNRAPHYHGPFQAPSTDLFREFCQGVVNRYHLTEEVKCAHVEKIIALPRNARIGHPFEVIVQNCSKHAPASEKSSVESFVLRPKAIVLAGGSLTVPRIPSWLEDFRVRFHSADAARVLHSCEILKQPGVVDGLHERSEVIIVGGGLTSGHLAVRACKAGHAVRLIHRAEIKVKQFDLDLEWMSNQRSANLAKFWSLSLEERVGMLRKVG